ncbi:fatty acyl-CoA hydrolase precursor, medium chain-like [Lineus longissimus]|uniref:fatty acyl-CoA hydrolase precursor, medium chain-like n=1 Tax=Lineus longissimus TaxID=88925 RepID=UPI002B4EA0D7
MGFARLSCLLLLISCALTGVHSVTVTTSVGDIIGFDAIWGDKTLQKFHGIPFAQAPIGDLRFSPPVPRAPFLEPFPANKFGSPCPQQSEWLEKLVFSPESQNFEMSEDCLSLNIYVPVGGEEKKPVMVWIHGGGFSGGAGMQYDGSKMAALGDVIVVTINYRLGLLGFFSTGDEIAAGNYGLLDQQLALKWVQQNIGAFGGDKDGVTIFGESAGSASVTWLMLAPSNKGLFNRVIGESGTALADWAMPKPEIAMLYKDILIEKLGCAKADSSQVMTCLRGLPTDAFASTASGYPHAEALKFKTPVGPRVDGDFIPYSPLSRKPTERMEDLPVFRSVDFLIGVNKYEGSPFIAIFMEPMYQATTNESLYDGVPRKAFHENVEMWGVANERADEDVAQALWYLYGSSVNGKQSDMMQARDLLEFMGDSAFYDGTIKFVKRHAAETTETTGTTFLYSFLPMPSKAVGGLRDLFETEPWIDGAIHGDELGFLFGKGTIIENEEKMEGGEVELSAALITYWTNFAKTGNPNEPAPVPRQWPQYKMGEEEFIEFDIQNKQLDLRISSFFRNRHMSFWHDVIPAIQACPFEKPHFTSDAEPEVLETRDAKTEL